MKDYRHIGLGSPGGASRAGSQPGRGGGGRPPRRPGSRRARAPALSVGTAAERSMRFIRSAVPVSATGRRTRSSQPAESPVPYIAMDQTHSFWMIVLRQCPGGAADTPARWAGPIAADRQSRCTRPPPALSPCPLHLPAALRPRRPTCRRQAADRPPLLRGARVDSFPARPGQALLDKSLDHQRRPTPHPEQSGRIGSGDQLGSIGRFEVFHQRTDVIFDSTSAQEKL